MTLGHSPIGPAYARASITPGTKHHHDERGELHQRLRSAFVVLEELYASGAIGGYGVSTWSGFDTGAFTVAELLRLAEEAAG
ncbi:hypothetical protein NE857_03255 [Nocardiopsis exhalans]|uniref:Uncharacterized protein n=1 Tax=Nocardiopsis exhalans TaxID=163604 RepID=A0ABY5DB24_9ACTN|nr:hypothetical protein [Nocardiopsis exhalans]USY20688.1 hypothetical protein NE857_03255 [Nocardiopsis exhalans]